MIQNRLSLLLAERQLKITKVANDTKISRTTLTSLMKNESKMIQLETINSLCIYLEIQPNDFFDFIPYNFSYHFDHEEQTLYKTPEEPLGYKANAFINILDPINGDFSFEYTGTLMDYSGFIEVYVEPINIETERDVQEFFNNISKSFSTQIEKEFTAHILDCLKDEFDTLDYGFDISVNLTNRRNEKLF